MSSANVISISNCISVMNAMVENHVLRQVGISRDCHRQRWMSSNVMTMLSSNAERQRRVL